jgi:aspartate carbamoyltransferase catalytic subunit
VSPYGLANYNVNIHLISPPTLSIRKESIYGLEKRELKIFEHEELHDNILTKLEVKGSRDLFYSEKIYIHIPLQS